MTEMRKRLLFLRGMDARADGKKRNPPEDGPGLVVEGSMYWEQGYDYMDSQIMGIMNTANNNLESLPIQD